LIGKKKKGRLLPQTPLCDFLLHVSQNPGAFFVSPGSHVMEDIVDQSSPAQNDHGADNTPDIFGNKKENPER